MTPRPQSDAEWQRIRAIVLARDRSTCQSCGEVLRSADADVHHLVPRSAGGPDEPANLLTLCDGCHAARHPNLHGGLARRMIERWGLRIAKWVDHQNQLADVPESLGAALRLLGASRFRGAQLDVVLSALRGESVLMVSATGSGKTHCFQVPVLLAGGFGMVLSPLKALMNVQVGALLEKKIPATFINGDLGPDEKRIRYQLIRDRAVKFVFCTPERFDPEMVRPAEVSEISAARPAYLVVDEAHCIDRWGSDFRPSYGRLAAIRSAVGNPPVLAFTATAGLSAQNRILESLGIPDARRIVTGVDRPNIALARLPGLSDADRIGLLAQLLPLIARGKAMIFVPTVRIGLGVQADLSAVGIELPFYHSRLGAANDRETLLGQFTGRLSPPVDSVICTTAFGMGLDVPDVRLVVHWQHPASVEDYLQEFGRAGRDALPSVAILFTDPRDIGLLEFMARKTVASAKPAVLNPAEVLGAKYEGIGEMAQRASMKARCFRSTITEYFEGPRTPAQRTLAMRIVEWVFRKRERHLNYLHCCDACDQVDATNIVAWTDQVLNGRRAGRVPW